MLTQQLLIQICTVLQLITFNFTLTHNDIHQRNVKQNNKFQM